MFSICKGGCACSGSIRGFSENCAFGDHMKPLLNGNVHRRIYRYKSVLLCSDFCKAGSISKMEASIFHKVAAVCRISRLKLRHISVKCSFYMVKMEIQVYRIVFCIFRHSKEYRKLKEPICCTADGFTVILHGFSIFVITLGAEKAFAHIFQSSDFRLHIHGKCIRLSFFHLYILPPVAIAAFLCTCQFQGMSSHLAVLCVRISHSRHNISCAYAGIPGGILYFLHDRVTEKLYNIILKLRLIFQAVYLISLFIKLRACSMAEAVVHMEKIAAVIKAVNLCFLFPVYIFCAVISISDRKAVSCCLSCELFNFSDTMRPCSGIAVTEFIIINPVPHFRKTVAAVICVICPCPVYVCNTCHILSLIIKGNRS